MAISILIFATWVFTIFTMLNARMDKPLSLIAVLVAVSINSMFLAWALTTVNEKSLKCVAHNGGPACVMEKKETK